MDWNWWLTFLENFGTGFLGGAAAVLASAKFLGKWWLEKQKARYSQQLEEFRDKLQQRQRHIQAELDRSVFVTRAHFETEFNAMKEVFAKLADVRLRMQGLRPFFDVEPANDTKDARLKRLAEKLDPFITSYNEFISMAENSRPFYPEAIYLAVEECRRVALKEINQLRTSGERAFTLEPVSYMPQ